MGLSLLEDLGELIAHNYQNYLTYEQHLRDIPGLRLLRYDESQRHNYQYVIVELKETDCAIRRDHLMEILSAENVLARRYFYPGVHRLEPYRSLYPQAGHKLPETERLVERVLCLPTGSSLHPNQVNTICRIIRTALDNDKDLVARWPFGGDPGT